MPNGLFGADHTVSCSQHLSLNRCPLALAFLPLSWLTTFVTSRAGQESQEHRGRGEEAAQALGAARRALEAARTELADLQAAGAAAEAAAPDWEARLAALSAELDAARAAGEEHRVRALLPCVVGCGLDLHEHEGC